jgi:hypothetical protein
MVLVSVLCCLVLLIVFYALYSMIVLSSLVLSCLVIRLGLLVYLRSCVYLRSPRDRLTHFVCVLFVFYALDSMSSLFLTVCLLLCCLVLCCLVLGSVLCCISRCLCFLHRAVSFGTMFARHVLSSYYFILRLCSFLCICQ